jgi:ribosomal-protein-alanine N-acetyltransferase
MLKLCFEPFPEMTTERLVLRKLVASDAKELFFLRSNPQVLQYLLIEPATSIDQVEKFIETINRNIANADSILWGIALIDEPNIIIGTICYWNVKPADDRAEIGYLLHPQHWRKGIMKEAMKKVIEYGFQKMKLHSIEADTDPHNIATISLLESNSFQKEAHLKENVFKNGAYHDSAIYSLLNT